MSSHCKTRGHMIAEIRTTLPPQYRFLSLSITDMLFLGTVRVCDYTYVCDCYTADRKINVHRGPSANCARKHRTYVEQIHLYFQDLQAEICRVWRSGGGVRSAKQSRWLHWQTIGQYVFLRPCDTLYCKYVSLLLGLDAFQVMALSGRFLRMWRVWIIFRVVERWITVGVYHWV